MADVHHLRLGMDRGDHTFHYADEWIDSAEISGKGYHHALCVKVRMNLTKKMHRVNPKPLKPSRWKRLLFSATAGIDIRTDVIAGKILAGGIR